MSTSVLFTAAALPLPRCLNSPSIPVSDHRFLPPEKLAPVIDDSRSIHQVLQIHGSLLRRGILPHHHPILNLKLLRSYGSHGRLHYSLALFHETPEPDLFLFTATINTLSVYSLHGEATSIYVQMLTRGILPNEYTFSSLLKSSSVQLARTIHSHVVKLGFGSDPYVATGLVRLYSKRGEINEAEKLFDKIPVKSLVLVTAMITCLGEQGQIDRSRKLFEEMSERDIACWNAMIDVHAQHGEPKEALMLFRRMLAAKVKPNELTILPVLSACSQIGALESGRWVHAYAQNDSTIRLSLRMRTALIDMYSKCGSLGDARAIFNEMREKDVVSWNSMIVGYAMHGSSHEAIGLFDEMCQLGLSPTDITFIGVLNACAHAGLVDQGLRLFDLMRNKFKIEPKVEHYGYVVNLLGRAGRLHEAHELARTMSVEPDPALWGTLLGACRLHGEFALGKRIADFLLTQESVNSGIYVLLSNIYAAEGDWHGVARVRNLMKRDGVSKEPGCSTIEIDNKVHEFRAGDRKHPKSEMIFAMLDEMNRRIRSRGYVSKTGLVLQDIEEAEKERSLEVHSEKLAIAFGLISTQPGTPLKIVKNLRVCSDCHEATKVISRVTRRRIVMRDRNRFHHFENGSCSCGDFW